MECHPFDQISKPALRQGCSGALVDGCASRDATPADHIGSHHFDHIEPAARRRFDGIYAIEHHADAHGLGPPPALMAAPLARRLRVVSIVLLGQLLALHNPPTRVAEVAMLKNLDRLEQPRDAG